MDKQVIKVIANLIIIVKKNKSRKSDFWLNKKYFEYRKKNHYIKNCYNSILNKRKSIENLIEKAKYTW